MRIIQTFFIAGVLATSGCSVAEVKPDTQSNEYCTGINELVSAYDTGFESMKRQRSSTRLMDIWATDFHLVGNSCEIWGWGEGRFDYTCSKVLPNQEVAVERYELAKKVVSECLPDWTVQESPRKLGEGSKALFQKGGAVPGVSLHVVATKGLFKSEWSAYVFVGNPNDQL